MKIILLIIILCFSITGLSHSQTLSPLKLSDNNKESLEPVNPVKKAGISDYKKQLSDQIFVTYNYIQNLGNFKNYYSDGQGFMLNYGKQFPDSWLLVVRSGYFKQNFKVGVDSGGFNNFNYIPLHFGGRFYVYKNVFMPYFSFMNGINIISASEFVGDPNHADESTVKYAYQVGFGFDVKFTKNFGINASINYNNSFWEDSDPGIGQEGKMMTGFEYVGGLVYNFSR